MASPQKENGHVGVANELAEQFAQRNFSGREWQVLWAVMRKTYGWNKKKDTISYSQLQAATGIQRRHLVKVIGSLVEKNVLIKEIGKKHMMILGIQKNYEKWNVKSVPQIGNSGDEKTQENQDAGVPQTGNPQIGNPETGTVPQIGNKSVPQIGNKSVPQIGNYKNKKTRKQEREPSTDLFGEIGRTELTAHFLRVISDYGKEWQVDLKKDAGWFVNEIERSGKYSLIGLERQLVAWSEWLETEHRRKQSGKSSKFPKNFKRAFRNWLDIAMEDAKKLGVGAGQQATFKTCSHQDCGARIPASATYCTVCERKL